MCVYVYIYVYIHTAHIPHKNAYTCVYIHTLRRLRSTALGRLREEDYTGKTEGGGLHYGMRIVMGRLTKNLCLRNRI